MKTLKKKESEDERIKKALIDYFKWNTDNQLLNEFSNREVFAWLEKQGTPAKLIEEEQNRFAKGVLTSCALSFIDYLDAHKYESKMCVSNGECEDIENAFHNAMWDSLHRYYCKYIVKQGEQKSVVIIPKFRIGDEIKTSNEESLTITKIDEKGYWSEDLFICSFDEECIWDLAKQKPADKVEQKFDDVEEVNFFDDFRKTDFEVEPKFKVGNWIVNNQTSNIYLVKEVKDDKYCLWPLDGIIEGYLRIIDVDTEYHLWTIKDVKPGDVLCNGTTIFIFKDLLSDGSVMSYCDYDADSNESDAFCPLSMNLICAKITPATKERRDKLEKAITEAGYRWDTDKNGLRKVEQKSTWSGEDDYNLQCCIAKVQSDIDNGRIGRNRELLNWLESLKDRYTWKPSEEQIIELRLVISGCSYDIEPLVELETKLKEL